MLNHEIQLCKAGALEALLPRLEGQVFHVTLSRNLAAILESGEIKSNIAGDLQTTFGSSVNSYFRNRQCVSVFDYRNYTHQRFNEFAYRCDPTHPAEQDRPIAFLFLDSSACARLIPWERSKEERVVNEMIVPYFEAGHPGSISMLEIKQILKLSVYEDESSNSLASRMERLRKG